jgi:hypothetical protein
MKKLHKYLLTSLLSTYLLFQPYDEFHTLKAKVAAHWVDWKYRDAAVIERSFESERGSGLYHECNPLGGVSEEFHLCKAKPTQGPFKGACIDPISYLDNWSLDELQDMAGEIKKNENKSDWIKIGNKIISVGDTACVPDYTWIDSLSYNRSAGTQGCGLEQGGLLEVMGFTRDSAHTLLNYIHKKHPRGTSCPYYTEFFFPTDLISKVIGNDGGKVVVCDEEHRDLNKDYNGNKTIRVTNSCFVTYLKPSGASYNLLISHPTKIFIKDYGPDPNTYNLIGARDVLDNSIIDVGWNAEVIKRYIE